MVKLANQDWIDRFRDTHGDKYTYGEFTTKGKNKSVEIFCADHGLFVKQVTNHWKGKDGTGTGGVCPRCKERPHQSNQLTRDEWVTRFRSVQPVEYDYDKADLTQGKMATVFCKDHGAFVQTKHDHGQGRVGCLGCRISLAEDKFLEDAFTKFGDRYDYSNFEYVNAKTKSLIICPEHGEFTQNPDKHLSSTYPCPVCNDESRIIRHVNGGGWYSKAAFQKSKELANRPAVVYYLRVGSLYKIGMTTDLKSRLSRIRQASRSPVEILDTHKCTAYDAYILEQNILINYDEDRAWRPWSTEIFNRDVLDGMRLSGYTLDETIFNEIR